MEITIDRKFRLASEPEGVGSGTAVRDFCCRSGSIKWRSFPLLLSDLLRPGADAHTCVREKGKLVWK